MTKATKAVPEGYRTLNPQLVLDDAPAAIDWYKKALGAQEVSRSLGPVGKVMHAELQFGDTRIMLNDAMMGSRGPKALGGSPVTLWLYVDDCDALFQRAVGAGAQVKMPVTDQFWGDRCGGLTDPHGYSWMIATRKEDLTRDEIERRAAEFFKQFANQPAHT
jgi:PhnB protein